MYALHPNPSKEHCVLTPDGGVIECRHEASARRVCQELNAKDDRIRALESALASLRTSALDQRAGYRDRDLHEPWEATDARVAKLLGVD